jgi:hypothetical protein
MILDRSLLKQQIVAEYGPFFWDEVFHDRLTFLEWLETEPTGIITHEWDNFGVHLVEVHYDNARREIVVIYDL